MEEAQRYIGQHGAQALFVLNAEIEDLLALGNEAEALRLTAVLLRAEGLLQGLSPQSAGAGKAAND